VSERWAEFVFVAVETLRHCSWTELRARVCLALVESAFVRLLVESAHNDILALSGNKQGSRFDR